MSSLADPRSILLTFLTTYVDTDGITKDNSTAASPHFCYSGIKSPLTLYFYGTKNHDVLVTVETPNTTAITDSTGQIMGYHERVPIQVYAINKTGITADLILWKAVQEIRYAFEQHWIGSYYSLTENTPATQDMGGWKLYSQKLTATYEREVNPAYTSGVTLSYADTQAFTYDGDRVAGGAEGTWALTGGGASQAISYGDYLALTRSGTDCDTTSGTSLAKLTTIHKKIRFRYKCSNANVQFRLTVYFTVGSQIVRTAVNTQTLTTETVALTADKTVTYLKVEALTADGTVYVDFIQIYNDDFTIPNFRYQFDKKLPTKNAILQIPGMHSDLTQQLGTEQWTVDCSCDRTKGTWTRSGMGDSVTAELLYEAAQVGGWMWLAIPDFEHLKVTLETLEMPQGATSDQMDWRVNFRLREYRLSSGNCAHENYETRLGLIGADDS